MSPRSAVLLLVLALAAPALAGCLQADPPAAVVDPPEEPAYGMYSLPLELPDSGGVSEPMLAVDSEGRIFMTAPSGLGTGSPLFISEDGGATWTRVMPNPTGLGGGDTSIAIGPDDEVYLTDLWAGSSTMLVSADHGKTWSATPMASQVPYHDREWNAVDSKGNAYYLARTFTPGFATWVSKSADGGKTWVHAGNPWNSLLPDDANKGTQNGPFFVNPKTDALAVVYSCLGARAVCLSTSADEGRTWTPAVAAAHEERVGNIFPAAAADAAGNYYVAYALREGGSTHIMMATSPDGVAWSAPVQVTEGEGVRLFPWMVAGDAGRIGITWYGTDKTGDNNDEADMEGAEWHVFAATSLNGLDAAPGFRTDRVTQTPVQVGTVSTGGLGGRADRSLGDFFANALDPEGRVHFAFVTKDGGKTSLVHAKQVAGESLHVAGKRPGHAHDDAENNDLANLADALR